MAFCDFCKAEGQKTGTCAYCGTVYYTAGVTFIYGQTEKESYLTERTVVSGISARFDGFEKEDEYINNLFT